MGERLPPGEQTDRAPLAAGEGTKVTFDPGKVTRMERQSGGAYEVELEGQRQLLCLPDLSQCVNAPPRKRGSYLEGLGLLPGPREEVERMIQEKIAAGKEPVCGTLPLGGVFFGTRANYERAVAADNWQIQVRILGNMASSPPAALVGAVTRMQGQSDARILDATEAMALLTTIGAAVVAPVKEPTVPHPPKSAAESHLHPAPRAPTAKTSRPPEPPRPVYPKNPTPQPAGAKRDPKLKDDLKRRSISTLQNGEPNPEFDPNTPNHIDEHFKRERERTGSDRPRDWRNPPGHDAQHPNGRPFAKYGEPPGTVLHWGTAEDNRHLQNAREQKRIPTIKPR